MVLQADSGGHHVIDHWIPVFWDPEDGDWLQGHLWCVLPQYHVPCHGSNASAGNHLHEQGVSTHFSSYTVAH